MSNAILNKIFDDHFHLRDSERFSANLVFTVQLGNIFRKSASKGSSFGKLLGVCGRNSLTSVQASTNNQRALFNGHKRIHAINFHSVVAPNEFIGNVYGPVKGKKHDSAMLTMLNVHNQLANTVEKQMVIPHNNFVLNYRVLLKIKI